SASAVATSDTELLIIKDERLEWLIRNRPQLTVELLKRLSKLVVATDKARALRPREPEPSPVDLLVVLAGRGRPHALDPTGRQREARHHPGHRQRADPRRGEPQNVLARAHLRVLEEVTDARHQRRRDLARLEDPERLGGVALPDPVGHEAVDQLPVLETRARRSHARVALELRPAERLEEPLE